MIFQKFFNSEDNEELVTHKQFIELSPTQNYKLSLISKKLHMNKNSLVQHIFNTGIETMYKEVS